MLKVLAELNIHIDEQPEIKDLKRQLDEAQAELTAAEAELDHIGNILNPLPLSTPHTPNVSELEVLRARQQEPFVRERYLLAKAAVLEIKPRFEQARSAALHSFNDARSRARVTMLRRFADALAAAKDIGDGIQAYDQETVQLGGSRTEHPFPQLLDEPPFRHGEATRVLRLVEELERH